MQENPCDVFVNIEESPLGKSKSGKNLFNLKKKKLPILKNPPPPKKNRKETVQLLYMKRLIYLKNGQSLDLLVSPLKKVVPDISRP
jgi:hypothetical protein